MATKMHWMDRATKGDVLVLTSGALVEDVLGANAYWTFDFDVFEDSSYAEIASYIYDATGIEVTPDAVRTMRRMPCPDGMHGDALTWAVYKDFIDPMQAMLIKRNGTRY